MKKIARKYEKKPKKVLYKVFEMCYCLNKQKNSMFTSSTGNGENLEGVWICREMTAKRAETANV